MGTSSKRPLWIEALACVAVAAFAQAFGVYVLLNALATGQLVHSLLTFAFGATP